MRVSSVGLAALAVLGVGLIAYGFSTPTPRLFPARIEQDSPEYAHLYDVLVSVDQAGRKGDLPRLRREITERFLGEVEQRVRDLGGERLDGMKLHEQGSFVGDVSALRFVAGAGDGSRAVLVFTLGTSDVAGRALQAFSFDAVSGVGRLDGKWSRALAPGENGRELAGGWAIELLR